MRQHRRLGDDHRGRPLLQDGRSYKVGGDIEDLLWWVIKSVRFEAGELDPYDPAITRLDLDATIV